MAISKVKDDLDSIARGIRTNQDRIKSALETLETVNTDFAEYPTRYAETIAEIGGYVPTGAFESLCKDELDKFVAQFTALVGAVTTAIGALEE